MDNKTKNKKYCIKIIIIGIIKHKIIYQCIKTKDILLKIEEDKFKIKRTILISNLSEKYNLLSIKSALYIYKNEIIKNYKEQNNLNSEINGLIKLNISTPYNLQYLLTSSDSSNKLKEIISDNKSKRIYFSSCELKKFLNEYYPKHQNKITVILLTETSGLTIFTYINSNIKKKIIDISYTDNSPSFIAGNIKIEIISLKTKYQDMIIHIYVTNSIKNIITKNICHKYQNIKIFDINESNVLHGTLSKDHDILLAYGILNSNLSGFFSIKEVQNKTSKTIKLIHNIIYYFIILIFIVYIFIFII